MVIEMISKEGARQMVTTVDLPMFERAGWVRYLPPPLPEPKQAAVTKKRK